MNEKLLTIDVSSLKDALERVATIAESGQTDVSARYWFSSREELLRTLSPGRWGVIEALTGAGPMGVRELARRVGRDVKGVHTDAQALVVKGLIDKTPDGKLSFPYNAVHVDFMLKAA
jgi:predicted transcriptional regulator